MLIACFSGLGKLQQRLCQGKVLGSKWKLSSRPVRGTIKRTIRNVSLCGCKLLAVIPKTDVVPAIQSDRCGERQGWMEPGENSWRPWSGGRGDLYDMLIRPEEGRGLLRV